MDTIFCGRTWLFGNNVDTDHIIPARYLSIPDYMEMSTHCFADVRPEFGRQRRDGEILVAGKNFGCGSSREFAPLVIKNRGISCIVAESFSRIFLRNAVNMGFPVVELPLASRLISEGDVISVDMIGGKIVDETKDEEYAIKPLPEFMMKIYRAGGLEGYIAQRLALERGQPVQQAPK